MLLFDKFKWDYFLIGPKVDCDRYLMSPLSDGLVNFEKLDFKILLVEGLDSS